MEDLTLQLNVPVTVPVPRENTQARLGRMAAANMAHRPSQSHTVADRIEQKAEQIPDKVFLLDGDQQLTFAQLNQQANQVAHAALTLGLKRGDVVSIMLENRFAFFSYWLGMAKIGVTAALLNTNTRGKALLHAFEITESKAAFIGEECIEALNSIDSLPAGINFFAIADSETTIAEAELPFSITYFDSRTAAASSENPDRSVRDGLVAENFVFYIFTSGTTGLPKAARISHMKWLGVGDGMVSMLNFTPADVFYCVLPLYHGAAGMSLTSSALSVGASIVLKRRFSVSQFWPEIRKYSVTTCQYIGEICRYLYNQPARPDDKDHTLVQMMGAGLGTDIWAKFQARFGVQYIYEGWSATEANTNMINLDNKVGSCGRLPFKDKTNARLIRYDLDAGAHARNDQGFCIECEPGEVGEMIGMILNLPDIGAGRFEGYTSADATDKKILRNVFQPGDTWFSSGDLLRKDAEDYYYFVDRVGDTYRWKSENVSTQEVTEAIGGFESSAIMNIYGVQVPGQEGRAGMAAIVLKENAVFDGDKFFAFAEERVPRYAAPMFVRISAQADLTATFKLRKVDLQKQGYDPQRFADPLYVRDESNRTYASYSLELLERLNIPPFE